MNIEAIYDNGRLTLPAHIRLNRQRLKVRLDIPDDALVSGSRPEQVPFEASNIRERIHAILGADKDKLTEAVVSVESDKAIWHKHLEEKYLGDD